MRPNKPQKQSKFKPTTGFVDIGEYFVCNCGVPLAKFIDSGWEIMKRDQGQVVKFTTKVTNGTIKIKCGVCERGMNFINITDSLSISDSVDIIKS